MMHVYMFVFKALLFPFQAFTTNNVNTHVSIMKVMQSRTAVHKLTCSSAIYNYLVIEHYVRIK